MLYSPVTGAFYVGGFYEISGFLGIGVETGSVAGGANIIYHYVLDARPTIRGVT